MRKVEKGFLGGIADATMSDQRRIFELEAALQPFAAMAESYRDDPAAFVIASKGGTIISVYDLREAAALLQKPKE